MKKILLLSTILFTLVIANIAFAQSTNPTQGGSPPGTVKLENPLGSGTSIEGLIGTVISAVLGIVGSIALAMFIYGGFLWLTSAGNSDKVTQGKNIFIWATLGLIMIFTSYVLLNFVFKVLGGS